MLPLWGTINCQAVSIAVTCPGSPSIAVGFHLEQHNYMQEKAVGVLRDYLLGLPPRIDCHAYMTKAYFSGMKSDCPSNLL